MRRWPIPTMLWLLTFASASAAPLRQSFDLQVAAPPEPVAVDGKRHLVYELRLASLAPAALELQRLDVLDAAAPATPLASWSGDALAARIAVAGASASAAKREIAPGTYAVIYLEVVLDARAATPARLRHRLGFRTPGSAADTIDVVQGGEVAVDRRPPPVLGPPLRGGPWAAIYGAAWPRGHRRVIFAVDGRARIPARFAIDWIRLDAEGRDAKGDATQVAHWYGYGEDVLAVADATVVATRNDYPESATLSDAKQPLDGASGNYVSLDLGGGRYAHYEHLKPGSVRVHVGERVRRGQVLAALGYTGDSTGPHLHFHVSDGATPLAGEGLPFVLDRFHLLGVYPSLDGFGEGARWTPAAPGDAVRRAELPAEDTVVAFPRTTARD